MQRYNNAWVAALCLAGTLGVANAGELESDTAPPAARAEPAPAPRDGYVWAGGYWDWNGHGYDWMPGHFVFQHRGAHWVPDHWDQTGARWHRTAGHWER
jgi:hypothetical protein